jgi:undecaprenyl diphosphate synthase
VARDVTGLEAFFGHKRERELLAEFDPSGVPRHVAIIMDGNGRWAQRRGLPRIAGHRAGVKAIRETIETCDEVGVRFLTLYSFSSENWSRPEDEVKGLMSLFVEVLEAEFARLDEKGVRIVLIGREYDLPSATRDAFVRARERTKDNRGLTLVVALNYGGRSEIVDAARSLAASARDGIIGPDDIDETAIADRLYTAPAGIPDPELVIRTSGEMRLSNFLLWQVAYAELWVTSVLWPDFKRHDLLKALVDFQKRGRRFGGAE